MLLPGLFDAHCHPSSLDHMVNMTKYRVTTTISMSRTPIDSCDLLRNLPGLSSFITAGNSATSPGSNHAQMSGFPQDQLISSPSDAPWFIANRVGNGSDFIKLVLEAGGLSQAELSALAEEAHRYDLTVATHASQLEAYNMALFAGTDTIQHLPSDGILSHAMIRKMVRHGSTSVPTLTIVK